MGDARHCVCGLYAFRGRWGRRRPIRRLHSGCRATLRVVSHPGFSRSGTVISVFSGVVAARRTTLDAPRRARYVALPGRLHPPAAGHPSRDLRHERDVPSDQLRDLTLGTARRDCVACQGRRVRSDVHQSSREARLVSRDISARQGAGALRRRAAAVRVERNRRIPRRDGPPAAASRGPDQARTKPRLDRLRARFLGRPRRGVLRRGRDGARQGDGSCARAACQARGSARRRAWQRRAVLQRSGAVSGRRRLRAVPPALRLRRDPARLRVAERVPAGSGVVGCVARERAGHRLGGGFVRARVRRQSESTRRDDSHRRSVRCRTPPTEPSLQRLRARTIAERHSRCHTAFARRHGSANGAWAPRGRTAPSRAERIADRRS